MKKLTRPGGSITDSSENPKEIQNATLPVLRLAVWFITTRVALWIIAGLAILFIPPGQFEISTDPTHWLMHWDSRWYLSIARNGYSYDLNARSNAAFFPLYPMLVCGLARLVPDLLVSGYLISNAFLFAGCLLLWKLIVRDYGNRALANRAVFFLLVCPLTVFYSSFYTESLFFFLVLCVAWFAGAGKWLGAGGCGFLAGLTRPPGALLVVMIATAYAVHLINRSRDRSHPKVFREWEAVRVGVAMLLPPSALFAFAYFLYLKFHDTQIMFRVHDQWSQHMIAPWNILSSGLIYHAFYMIWFYAALGIAWVLAGLAVRYRLRPVHLAMLFSFLLLYCTNSLLEALPRYLSVLFPFYIVAAAICLKHPRIERWFFGVSIALATLSIVLFVDGYWFT